MSKLDGDSFYDEQKFAISNYEQIDLRLIKKVDEFILMLSKEKLPLKIDELNNFIIDKLETRGSKLTKNDLEGMSIIELNKLKDYLLYKSKNSNDLNEKDISYGIYLYIKDVVIPEKIKQQVQQAQQLNYTQIINTPQLARGFVPQLPEGYNLHGNGISITGPYEEGFYNIEITISKPRGKIKSYEILFKNNSGIVYFYDKYTRRQISYSIIDNHGNTTLNYNGIAMKINVAKPRIYDRRENRRH